MIGWTGLAPWEFEFPFSGSLTSAFLVIKKFLDPLDKSDMSLGQVLPLNHKHNKSPDTLHPAPYTLHPTPCTLHPTPCTLHPAPCTLHPAPYTLHPASYTLHPTPRTLRPTLCTRTYARHLIPETRKPNTRIPKTVPETRRLNKRHL